jgi:hypothetical protein
MTNFFMKRDIKEKNVGEYILNQKDRKVFKIYSREEIIAEHTKKLDK